MRFFSQHPSEAEAARLREMGYEDHLQAAALAQGRASNPRPGDTDDSVAAHEQRAQTHLLWAIALGPEADEPPEVRNSL